MSKGLSVIFVAIIILIIATIYQFPFTNHTKNQEQIPNNSCTTVNTEVRHKELWGKYVTPETIVKTYSTDIVCYRDDLVFDLSKIDFSVPQEIKLVHYAHLGATLVKFYIHKIDQTAYNDGKSVKILDPHTIFQYWMLGEEKNIASKNDDKNDLFTTRNLYPEFLNYFSNEKYILVRVETMYDKENAPKTAYSCGGYCVASGVQIDIHQ